MIKSLAVSLLMLASIPAFADGCKVVNGSGVVKSFNAQTSATVTYNGDNHTARVDTTKFDALFGAFPGKIGSIATDPLPISNYVSLAFTAPAGYFVNPLFYRDLSVGTTNMDTLVSMTISTSCGDFSNPTINKTSTVVPGCYKVGVRAEGRLPISGINSKVGGLTCHLQEGVKYYWNIINADVSHVTPAGGSATTYRDVTGSACKGKALCKVPVYNGPSA